MKEGIYAQRPPAKIQVGAIFHMRDIFYKNFYFFQSLQLGAESSKSCNLIGSESRRYFTILLANPGGIVGIFIHNPYQIQHCFECIFKLFLKTVFNLFCEIGFK